MKRINLILLAGLVALLALASSASAVTVVNFDDLKGGGAGVSLPPGYAGLTWDSHWFYWDFEQYPYTPHSNYERIASHNYGGWIGFPAPVDFKGAWFSGGGTPCYIEGYKNSVKVGQSATVTTTATPTFLPAEFNVDKVNIVCGEYNHFSVDDITYDTGGTQAPEFPTAALPVAFIVGLLGVILVLKRTQE